MYLYIIRVRACVRAGVCTKLFIINHNCNKKKIFFR